MVLLLTLIPAVWHVVDFDEDLDVEFPNVIRPTFSRVPAAAYRLAEPGDTLDRVMIYFSAAGVVMAVSGLALSARGRVLAGGRCAGCGGALVQRDAGVRLLTAGTAWAGDRLQTRTRRLRCARGCWRRRSRSEASSGAQSMHNGMGSCISSRRRSERGTLGLWVAAGVLALVTAGGDSWGRAGGLLAAVGDDLGDAGDGPGLVDRGRAVVQVASEQVAGAAGGAGGVAGACDRGDRSDVVSPAAGAIQGGRAGKDLHECDADCAGARGGIRRGFRSGRSSTCFRKRQPQGSPISPAEIKFAHEHGIRYLGSPSDPTEAASNAFLDETLALAQDESAWPILVHCHGCMDRSPAWMGIYQFVVKGRPLLEVMQEIERHRGYRPKASVILLYNRVLPRCAGAAVLGRPDGGRAAAVCGGDGRPQGRDGAA